MDKFLWLIICYFLGSIPSGFLVSRYSGKDILNIGWRKTSGSNVFKNVGKWQGIITAVMDIGKGYLAVWGAQKMGFSSETQALSGVAALIGNNWSLFLNFAGGRGLGLYGGAVLAISPLIFIFCLITIILLGIIWDASIGTITLLALAIFLSNRFGLFSTVGVLTLLSLIPIFLKRLSPIKELSFGKKGLFINRLIFDDDYPKDFRIKRIIKRLTEK
jgi:glycerol-3-phosphate acyltransferase PlsY